MSQFRPTKVKKGLNPALNFQKDWTLRGLNEGPESADKFLMGVPALNRSLNNFRIDRKDWGKADTLKYNVLTYVVDEDYEKAISELKAFLEKDFEYPKFKKRIERYIHHAIDLVNAIRAKRSFPGAQMMTMAKQQELNERFLGHFQELQTVLKRVEHIHDDVRIEDVRSTVWIVRTFAVCIFAVAISAFLMEVNRGLLHTTYVVIDDYFHQLTEWIFR